MRIVDNGKGFDIATDSEGNGLFSMTRRAESVGGKIVIESGPGKGTTVSLRLPYSKTNALLLRR